MRAYLIDAVLRKIVEFDLEDYLNGVDQLLGHDGFTLGSGPLNKPLSDDCDDEEMFLADYLYVRAGSQQYFTPPPGQDLPPADPRFWFQIDAERDQSFPIPGRGLVIGVTADGCWTNARITLDEQRNASRSRGARCAGSQRGMGSCQARPGPARWRQSSTSREPPVAQ